MAQRTERRGGSTTVDAPKPKQVKKTKTPTDTTQAEKPLTEDATNGS